MLLWLSPMFSTIGVLLGVAFLTLMERKVMGIMHYRKGPNKVLLSGILQPISDAMKLLTKEYTKIKPMNLTMFWIGPLIGIFLMTSCWLFYESTFTILSNKMKILTIMAIMSLSVFIFLLTSWGSNSNYSIVGGYRSISQVISYEVCFMLFVLIVIYMSKTFNPSTIMMMQENWWFMNFSYPLFFTWVIMCMAESNRTPFDLTEGESEIVSGFNIEYGGGLFALIFITEYGMIMFMSFLTSLLFLGMSMLIMKTFLFCFLYVWIRCSFPRMRYDKLMDMCWKVLLIYIISMLTMSILMFLT